MTHVGLNAGSRPETLPLAQLIAFTPFCHLPLIDNRWRLRWSLMVATVTVHPMVLVIVGMEMGLWLVQGHRVGVDQQIGIREVIRSRQNL